MLTSIGSCATVAAFLALAGLVPLSAHAHCPPSRTHAGHTVRMRAPATIYVTAEGSTRASDFWSRGVAARARSSAPPVGLMSSARDAASRSHQGMSRAFDPVVDPLLEATTTTVGAVVGTALGVGLYPPVKVLEHVLR